MRVAVVAALALLMPVVASAQGRPELRVEKEDGSFTRVPLDLGEGYASVPLTLFDELGWSVTTAGQDIEVAVPGEISVSMTLGTPFFRWDGVVLQMTEAPYRRSRDVFVPVQLLTDFFPRRLPDLYEFDGSISTLRAGDPALLARAAGGQVPGVAPEGRAASGPVDDPVLAAPSRYEGPRVVVIDAGHGGADPGALGPAGLSEKSIALGIALEMERRLRDVPGLEVHMIRDEDTFVDVWERGQIATRLKGDRPGVFVSIHANSFPARRAATGFETYFLADARTEHERRVEAIENAPMSVMGQDVDREEQPDLAAILSELRNLDHQHWSALLAEMVQSELDPVHPGPNRGVKQGVLAVLTNALMPSVLVEVGYLSNDREGRLLGEAGFQTDAAEAIAAAVGTFFDRYPPGSGLGGGSGR